jgi:hypothetical protein
MPPGSARGEAIIRGAQPVAVAGRVGSALALIFDDFRLGPGDKLRIAELGGDPREFGVEPGDLLFEPDAFASQIDDIAKRHDQRRTIGDDLYGTRRHRRGRLDPLDPSKTDKMLGVTG